MSYQNIKAEMRRERITQESIATFLGMSTNNLSLKLNGKVVLTVPEAIAIRDRFFPDAALDYLLVSTKEHSNERNGRLCHEDDKFKNGDEECQ